MLKLPARGVPRVTWSTQMPVTAIEWKSGLESFPSARAGKDAPPPSPFLSFSVRPSPSAQSAFSSSPLLGYVCPHGQSGAHRCDRPGRGRSFLRGGDSSCLSPFEIRIPNRRVVATCVRTRLRGGEIFLPLVLSLAVRSLFLLSSLFLFFFFFTEPFRSSLSVCFCPFPDSPGPMGARQVSHL